MLLGRERECARLDSLADRVGAGGSAALLLRGAAGIGKTSLLEHAAAQGRGAGLRVLRAHGVESEQNLPFAGLATLLHPVLGCLDAIPVRQHEALAGALAVGPACPADQFVICAATLSLLGAAAAERPLLALVDDLHWLDAASAKAVEFAARRLGTEALGLIMTARTGDAGSGPGSAHDDLARPDATRIDTMTIGDLDAAAARELLTRSGYAVAPGVAERLVAGVGGNPLALLELPAALTSDQLSGTTSLPEPLPVSAALRHSFTQRLSVLDDSTRRLLVLAAAGPADLATIHRAARRLDLDLDGIATAAEASVLRVESGLIEFTHPLLRSAAYYSVPPGQRRAAHRALADATGKDRDPARHAWHLSAAAISPDEEVAASLDLAARAARDKNAFTAASRAHQRAAELTPAPDRQVRRWTAAGEAAYIGGDPFTADQLLRRALALAADPCTSADIMTLIAQATIFTAPPDGVYREAMAAAEAVLAADRAKAAALLGMASSQCILMARMPLAKEAATRAAALVPERRGFPWLLSQMALAVAAMLSGDRAAGRDTIARLLSHPDMKVSDPATCQVRLRCGLTLLWCADYGPAARELRGTADGARTRGGVTELPFALAALSDLYFRTGDWNAAYAHATEAVELGTDWGKTRIDLGFALFTLARIEAVTGAAASCREHLAQATRLAEPMGLVPTMSMYTHSAAGLLELGAGDPGAAAAELAQVAALAAAHDIREPEVIRWRPDFIESLARLGRGAEAREQLTVLDAEAAATGSQWAAATAARCRGLLQDTPRQAIGQLREALALAEASPDDFERARTRLCLAQALRRGDRHGEARRQAELARSAFERLGAVPWTKQATAALGGDGMPRQEQPVHARLTPAELRVALHVAEGITNAEVAARLFVSHKTIEVHLGHIYDKLGVRTRTALARLVHAEETR